MKIPFKIVPERLKDTIIEIRYKIEIPFEYRLGLSQRLAADKDVFAATDEGIIRSFSNIMAQQMLVFLPTNISADVTDDASVIFQAHYGDLHCYWECFFDSSNEIPPYATLNISQNKKIIFTNGGDFPSIQRDFITFIMPRFKGLYGHF